MFNDHPTSYARFAEEPIGWLTTVSGAGKPSTAPVWFYLEDDDSITIYSRDPSLRVRNLASNSQVTLHLEGDGRGGAIVVANGRAELDASLPAVTDHPRYLAKYQSFLDNYGWTAEWFAENYPATIRMTISSVVGS
ncbi:MAG: pyridoxamine 5'-phosphate oxidase family protein [Acidimicrobiia bacterium]